MEIRIGNILSPWDKNRDRFSVSFDAMPRPEVVVHGETYSLKIFFYVGYLRVSNSTNIFAKKGKIPRIFRSFFSHLGEYWISPVAVQTPTSLLLFSRIYKDSEFLLIFFYYFFFFCTRYILIRSAFGEL